jgi:predicted TIM-barrel fold metal-dependent hydrolase
MLIVLAAAGIFAAACFGDLDQGMVLAKDVRVVKKPKFYPVVEAHAHLRPESAMFDLAVKAMDAAGASLSMNLSGGSGKVLDKALSLAARHKGRFITFCGGWPAAYDWKAPDIGKQLAKMIAQSKRQGAAGFGEVVKWALQNWINWDDPRLLPMWEKLEELQFPINWHVADPSRYWMKETATRMLEAPDYRKGHLLKHEIIMQQDRVLERFPKLVVIASHANWLNDQIPHLIYRLETYPNYYFDLSAACDEFGMDREDFRDVCIEYSDRIFFGTDAGYSTESLKKHGGRKKFVADYKAFYLAHLLFLGTDQRMIPCAWKGAPGQHFVGYENGFVRFANDGISLPDEVLRDIYYRNAERMFGIKVRGWRPEGKFSYEKPA